MRSELFRPVVDKREAFIIVPKSYKKTRRSKWVIYHTGSEGTSGCVITHKWNEKSSIIDRLLKNGFIVCAISVGPDHWGNRNSYKSYNALYRYVRKHYLVDKKVCLLGQSMGGLTSLTWAAKNAEKVKCLYEIYPLFDLECIARMGKVYREAIVKAWGFSSGNVLDKIKKHNPVNMLGALAKKKIPIIQRHGLVDKVVLHKQNAADFAEKYRKLGGEVKLITLKKYGHETYRGFFNPGEVTRFFLS